MWWVRAIERLTGAASKNERRMAKDGEEMKNGKVEIDNKEWVTRWERKRARDWLEVLAK